MGLIQKYHLEKEKKVNMGRKYEKLVHETSNPE